MRKTKSLKLAALLCASLFHWRCSFCLGNASKSTLTEELEHFAWPLLPTAEDRARKEELLRRLHAAAAQGVAQLREPLRNLRVVPFGSSVNGCGERHSDVDAALWGEPPEGRQVPPSEVLKRLAAAAPSCGLTVLEQRFAANVPLLVVGFVEDENVTDGITCDVSAFHLLPCYNTQLLRRYATLLPSLATLVLALKRWAKRRRLAKTWENYISSYSWTLLMIFFLQVKHGLPSLHQLLRRQPAPLPRRTVYALDFAEGGDAGRVREEDVGDLFRGFFRYYSEEFRFEEDVVSVRLGAVRAATAAEFHPKLFRSVHIKKGKRISEDTPPFLNIEDPIEVQRNLNFALTEATALEIRSALRQTHADLSAGATLRDVLGDVPRHDASVSPSAEKRCQSWRGRRRAAFAANGNSEVTRHC